MPKKTPPADAAPKDPRMQALAQQQADLREARTGTRMDPAVSAKGRAAQLTRLERLVDPEGVLPPGELARRVDALRRARMRAMRHGWPLPTSLDTPTQK